LNAAQAQESVAQKLTVGISQYPSTFHPGIDSMMAKSYMHGFTRVPLTVYNPNWERICMLCTELPTKENGRAIVETRDNGTQGIAARYTLQEDAKWGDGTPVTTDDIIFTWQVGKDPLVGISNFALFSEDIINITAHDDKNFTIHYDQVTCDFNELADFDVLPAHIERSIYQADPAQYKIKTAYDTTPSNPGLYTGPFVITEARAGQSITLKRNPHWWGEKAPFFDEITLSTIENTNALSAQLLTGQIDMISGELGLSLDQAQALEKRLTRQNDRRFVFTYKPGLIYEHIDLNHDHDALSNTKVRQALLHSIDREAISQQLFEGKQAVAHHNIHPMDNVYIEDIKRYSFDKEKALALFSQAGWTKSKDGILRNSDGEALRFTFRTTSGNKSRELVQQAIQSGWTSLGIQASIKNETPRVLFGETLTKRLFDGAAMYAWLSAPNNIPKTTLHSSMIPSEDNGFSGQNYIGFNNPQVDQIIDDLEVQCSAEQQKALWSELQHIYAEELPALPLYFRADSFILPQWLKGVEPTGHQFPSSLWSYNWHRD
jgi:peptide/nickel transport system substrate-binding protein